MKESDKDQIYVLEIIHGFLIMLFSDAWDL